LSAREIAEVMAFPSPFHVYRRIASHGLCVMNPDGSDQRMVATVDKPIHSYSLSPDGTEAAITFWEQDQELYILTLATGQLRRIGTQPSAEGYPSWRWK
jgi:Tol biopolymer transport system component